MLQKEAMQFLRSYTFKSRGGQYGSNYAFR